MPAPQVLLACIGAYLAGVTDSLSYCSSCASQVPCRFNGGVVVGVDRFRTTMGGWVRLVFKNVNGPPVDKVEFSKVRCVD